ncbi:MAG: rhodanese-like domain-containing protein [Steroidobacteraceae bacterium]
MTECVRRLAARFVPAGLIAISLLAGCAAVEPVASTGAAAPQAAAPAVAPVAELSQSELLGWINRNDGEALILDVRTSDEFAAGHLPGAVNLPHDQVAARIGELAAFRDRPVVAYCRSGRRAGMALEVLQNAGFKQLNHLQGDYLAWQEADMPIEGASPATTP